MDYTKHEKLEFQRRFLVLVGAKIEVIDPVTKAKVGFIKMKAWKLREDIRLYADESEQNELLRIHGRNIIDFGGTYDVFEGEAGKPVYSLRRKGLKSTFVRDHWDILDSSEKAIGAVQETSSRLALIRRWIGIIPIAGPIIDLALAFVPQTYDVTVGEQRIAAIAHRKNPILVRMELDMSMAPANADKRLGVAATSLLSIIDAAKE